MRITVVGCGYVGLVTAACFAELGHEVICVDNDRAKLAALMASGCTIHEAFLPELLDCHRGARLHFSDCLIESARLSSAIFIAVGTPASGDGTLDLSQVKAVARDLAPALTDGYRVVVCKSTVPVKTTELISRLLLLNGAVRSHFDVACNPEFLREGTAVVDFLYPERIISGAASAAGFQVLREIYAPLLDGGYNGREQKVPGPEQPPAARLIETSLRSAELIKTASNAFLAMKISFINAIATLCESTGADVTEVARGVGADTRIGGRFLNPGIGYGGSCFPKDLASLRAVAGKHGYEFRLLDEVARINLMQRQNIVQKVRRLLWSLNGRRIGVLGLSYKGGTDDIRESPAIAVVKLLLDEGCSIVAYDPAAAERACPVFAGRKLRLAADAYAAAEGADALLILTDWSEFAEIDLRRMSQLLNYPVLIDGRNLFQPEQVTQAGLCYFSIGRSDAIPAGLRAAFAQPAVNLEDSFQSVREPLPLQSGALAVSTGSELESVRESAGEARVNTLLAG